MSCVHRYALSDVRTHIADGMTSCKEYELTYEKCGRVKVVDKERYHAFVKLRIAEVCRKYREADE